MKIIAQAVKTPVYARTALDDDTDLGDLAFDDRICTDSCTEVDADNFTFFLTLQQILQAQPDRAEKIIFSQLVLN